MLDGIKSDDDDVVNGKKSRIINPPFSRLGK